MGPAGLGDLPGEPAGRDIDWTTFRKFSKGDPAADRMAVLIYPTTEESGGNVPILTWSRDPRNPAVLLCRVRAGAEEDLHIFSDGSPIASGPVTGSFTYACLHQRNGQPVWISATGATHLRFGDRTLLDSGKPLNGEWTDLNPGEVRNR
jgi:hypothetical protein